MSDLEVQTRSEETSLSFFTTVKAAMAHAEKDRTVWKISWSRSNGERIRLVKKRAYGRDFWIYEPLMAEVEKELIDNQSTNNKGN